MSESSRNFAVGLTALAGLAGLCFLVVLFGYVPQFLERTYPVTVHMPSTGGLNRANRVTLSGLDIGRVESVTLGGQEHNGVVVRLAIREGVAIPRAARVAVAGQLFGGSSVLSFDTSGLTAEQLQDALPTDGTAVVRGEVRSFTSALGEALAEPTRDLARITASFEALSDEWRKVGQGLNALLEPRDLAAVERGELAANLTTLLQHADQDLVELNRTLVRINGLLADQELIGDLKATAAGAAVLTRKYAHVADELAVAVAAMTRTLEQARAGEGTVGRLMSDPALYNNLNDAAIRLGTALREVQDLLIRLKNEGLPLRFE